ncbi:tetratricopeptide repeat protein [Undibacterium sp.]|uniref:tetratricopeptide repeat protein n=1 Tax=Undibacterium sp. TaxID=1914977 RepID=UPI002C8F5803|nr:tetratricopeptide repeat protein [Undibacterium sp.]HTD05435.1 tetratricopeptide repeat protein [Undibacterium sp.]
MDTARITSFLQQAVGLQQQGRFGHAEDLYLQVLQMQADNFDALHLLGVLARQTRRPELALDLINRAIQVNPHQAAAYCNAGAALQDLGRPEEALASYDKALQIKPDYALALNNRGNALRNLLRYDEALGSYMQAIAIKPDYAEAYNNHGTVLHKQRRHEAATLSYQRALQLNPKFADALNNLGIARHAMHAFEAAVAMYDRALRIKADHADAYCNRGMALQKLQRFQQAVDSYDRALRVNPRFANAHMYRANSLRSLGRKEEAIEAYMQAGEHGTDAEQVNYALAALGVLAAPAASPTAYVKELFDQYAGHFDQHLLDGLQYRTPALLVEMVKEFVPAGALDIVDLGCGTGLCGSLLKPLSRTLTGIDISPNMLDQAARRDVYDNLVCAEIVEFLGRSQDCCDVVLAADVFVYIGELAGIFAAAHRALRVGGIFAFSVEESEQDDVVLRISRRFAHSASYLRRVAQEHGFVMDTMDRRVIRQDDGMDLYGYLAVMHRA